ncbi:ketopantoate reductase family protein [Azospirillum canadense]|uniref:ketopantoate reductase family protein n=1 Tax=Azospirillum canadense TaxID=403962 RepID=UPI002227B182|nr:2-dehydropantoate 2-reductase [Azospirillum canadense]MCW2239827.1 2-dehydropantoate 2-reductase [Azospirillum canadense]
MKVCVYGAGAVGGHIAGRLMRAGADVSVIARGPHLAAIKDHGLLIEAKDGDFHGRPKASDDARDIGEQDVVIVSVKAPSLPQIADGLRPLLGVDTRVVFAMNGIPWWYFHAHGGALDGTRLARIDPDDRIWTAVAPERVVGAIAYTACTVRKPGVIHAENARNRIILGRPDGAPDARVDELAGLLTVGGLEMEVTGRIRDAIWAKLLMNLTGGTLGVLTASAMRDALSHPVLADAASAIAAEGAAIARALGCDPGDPGTVRSRLSVSGHKQSVLQDLELGRAMEIDALFRVPLEIGRMVGVATPTLDLVTALVIQRAKAAGLYAD